MLSALLLACFAVAAQAQTAGVTTRYWDCCKPSCAWPGKASLKSPLNTCGKNDQVLSDPNAKSGCDGGGAFMCTNNAPIVINDNLSYGTAATAFSGGSEAASCCACYELTFTSGPVAGKKMVVQSINTGGDVGGSQFDIAIPGGGVGLFNGCTPQYGTSASAFGATYGGVSSLSQCDGLPSALQAGCKWRFGWYKGADNPQVSYKKVACPAALVARTGCLRSDDTASGDAKPVTITTSVRMTTSLKPTSTNSPATTTKASTGAKAALWAQCGGKGWTGATACASGTCRSSGEYYSQCVPA